MQYKSTCISKSSASGQAGCHGCQCPLMSRKLRRSPAQRLAFRSLASHRTRRMHPAQYRAFPYLRHPFHQSLTLQGADYPCSLEDSHLVRPHAGHFLFVIWRCSLSIDIKRSSPRASRQGHTVAPRVFLSVIAEMHPGHSTDSSEHIRLHPTTTLPFASARN